MRELDCVGGEVRNAEAERDGERERAGTKADGACMVAEGGVVVYGRVCAIAWLPRAVAGRREDDAG